LVLKLRSLAKGSEEAGRKSTIDPQTLVENGGERALERRYLRITIAKNSTNFHEQ
jgi:hypothetical protein